MRNNRMCNRAQRTARLLAALALAALLLALQAGACFADTADAGSTKSTGEYGYTIRIYTGNQGTFADGSTKMAYKDITLDSSNVIEGFAYALSLMHPHEKGMTLFYSGVGYKESGSGDAIPGFSPLRFDIEIVDKP